LPATTETELQNPADDKGEKNNLAEKYPQKVNELSGLLQKVKDTKKPE